MIAFWLWVLMQPAVAQSSLHSCDFPKDLEPVIETRYPGTHVVNLSDLNEDDKKLFLQDHGDSCPGLVAVDFYGDGKPTFALALAARREVGFSTKLVVARRVGPNWKTVFIDKTGGPAPVIWSEKPGEYKGVYGGKITSSRPVILFVGYGSWAVMYAWDGQKIRHIQIVD